MAKAEPQAVIFRVPTRHGTILFPPSVSLAFEDEDAAPYFVAAGFADKTSDTPAMTYPIGQIDIDPDTVFGGGDRAGQKVMSNG